MNMPWSNKTGLAKAAAFCAALLLVSLGLCGINLVISGHNSSGKGTIQFLIMTGFFETLGILIGVVGLVVVILLALMNRLLDILKKREDGPR
jgi:hypothetical protein